MEVGSMGNSESSIGKSYNMPVCRRRDHMTTRKLHCGYACLYDERGHEGPQGEKVQVRCNSSRKEHGKYARRACAQCVHN